MPSRSEVYAAIDGERAYQDAKWGGKEHDATNLVADWLAFIKRYTDVGMRHLFESTRETSLHEVRKIGALAVACMEVYGAPAREGVRPCPSVDGGTVIDLVALRRERIATAALQGLLACPDVAGDIDKICGWAVDYADALIARLEKKQ